MSTPEFTRRERMEVMRADTSRRLWLRREGSVFWRNARAHARPEQRGVVLARLQKAERRGGVSS
jgi:hypothetical protein